MKRRRVNRARVVVGSSSTRGTWIETQEEADAFVEESSRPPHGGRGLKLHARGRARGGRKSSSTRGTWIETYCTAPGPFATSGRPPHGGRGLKPVEPSAFFIFSVSSSTRGTWIETAGKSRSCGRACRSSSTRGTWIETLRKRDYLPRTTGRPPHGGRGLKHRLGNRLPLVLRVVLHTGDVD